MEFKWVIDKETDFSQNIDFDLLNEFDEDYDKYDNSSDNDLWFANCLLDIKAFKQYKDLEESDVEEKEKYYSEILEQYRKIDEIILDAIAHEAQINSFYKKKLSPFETEFADFISDITKFLSGKDSLAKEISVPTSEDDTVNKYLQKIKRLLQNYEEEIKVTRQIRKAKSTLMKAAGLRPSSSVWDSKCKIRDAINNIAKNYSEESKKRYSTLSMLRRKYNSNTLRTYDCACFAMCGNDLDHKIYDFINEIKDTAENAFQNSLSFEDFKNGLSEDKIDKINHLFNNPTPPKGTNPNDILPPPAQKYLKGRRRCVAIMEFPQRNPNDMFALSGIELDKNKNYKTNFKLYKADPIGNALFKIIGKRYDFCKQRKTVRRYCQRSGNNFTPINPPEMLDNDPNWLNHQLDYSCCERKFLAKLEEDQQLTGYYPNTIFLWARFKICQNCQSALNDKKYTNNAQFLCI